MELGNRPQIDGESELDVLALSQSEIRGLDEHACRAQIHGFAELSPAAGSGDVDGSPGAMPSVQTAFQVVASSVLLFAVYEVTPEFSLCLRSMRSAPPTELIMAG